MYILKCFGVLADHCASVLAMEWVSIRKAWTRFWVAIFFLFYQKNSITGENFINWRKNSSGRLRKGNLLQWSTVIMQQSAASFWGPPPGTLGDCPNAHSNPLGIGQKNSDKSPPPPLGATVRTSVPLTHKCTNFTHKNQLFALLRPWLYLTK